MQSDGTRNSSPLESNLKSHNNVRLWCHLHFKISTLHVASYYGYSVHYHPPFLKKKFSHPFYSFSPWKAIKWSRYYCVFQLNQCVTLLTHPLGPGLCPCVKRQSLLGGFCCEENRRCSMKYMFHRKNSKKFLRCSLVFLRIWFVVEMCAMMMYVCVYHLACLYSFSLRLIKALQMATNNCTFRHPCCPKHCGA